MRYSIVAEDEEFDQVFIRTAFQTIGITDGLEIVGDGAEAIAYMMGEGKYSDRTKFPHPAETV